MSECRICFSSDPRFLISPCMCKGSVQFVHQKCLLRWLRNKYPSPLKTLLIKSRSGRTGMKCELCKYEYRGEVTFLHLKPMLKKLQKSSSTYSMLMNIPIIIYLLYKCYAILRHIFCSFASKPGSLRLQDGLLTRFAKFLRFYLEMFIKIMPLWGYGMAIPLVLLSTAKMAQQLYFESKTVKFESIKC
jgi:hypothetical protein